MMNVLVLSCGTRNKIIRYLKRELAGRGRVVATDMSPHAPALYDADQHYIVPRMTAEGYIDVIFEICRKEQITGVFSLIDPELSLLAQHEEAFRELGVLVFGSSYELCERCLNKWEMYLWLERHGYACVKNYIQKQEFFQAVRDGVISYPVFVKPICGSASMAISKAEDEETIEFLFRCSNGMLIQEYQRGQEIGVDCYIDMISGELISIFAKKKLAMRAGETDKSISFKDGPLFDLVGRFVRESGFRGQIDIDLFDYEGTYYISEVNPRFGGGYPHAYEAGVNHMKYMICNLLGQANVPEIGKYEEGIVMMKYHELMMLRGEDHIR